MVSYLRTVWGGFILQIVFGWFAVKENCHAEEKKSFSSVSA